MLIRRLDNVLINQIAAGEVIDRPAAAIKELIENSIDAKSTHIKIHIEQGGRRLIRVEDNGIGMRIEDLALSIERHATSKLNENTLENVRTLGFRGEALPSIGSVARLTITSRSQIQENANQICVDAGVIYSPKPASFGIGTRVKVENLFYATPARLKFLKSDRAETQTSIAIIKRLSLANPTLRFTLSGDNLTPFDFLPEETGQNGVLARIKRILGDEFAANSVYISTVKDDISLTGFVSIPTFHKAIASDQYLFVNGRPVKDKLLVGALRAAYADSIFGGRYPIVALFLDISPERIDVNVHPAKLEVRFRESEKVRSLIVSAIRDAIYGAQHRVSTSGASAMLSHLSNNTKIINATQKPLSFATPALNETRKETSYSIDVRGGFSEGNINNSASSIKEDENTSEQDEFPLGHARAQFHETYILSQTKNGIIIVDQHAAHERLVYERLKKTRENGIIPRQILLIPIILEMDESLISALLEHQQALNDAGLVLDSFGMGGISVEEIPSMLSGGEIANLVRDLAEHIREWGGIESLSEKQDYFFKTFACHHSIRAGRRLKLDEMDALLREMEATPHSGQCNHGRPTYISLNINDIERLFARK